MRAPLLVDMVIEAALDHIQKGMASAVPHDRAVASDLMRNVLSHRQHVVDSDVRSLRDHVADKPERAAPTAESSLASASTVMLLLGDDDEVTVDMEISHCVQAIRSVAEYALREPAPRGPCACAAGRGAGDAQGVLGRIIVA